MDSKSRGKSRLNRSILTLVSFFGLVLFYLTGYLYTRGLTGADSPGCRIVYMGPSYARITAFDESHTKFASKYSLYLYREQGRDPLPDENEGFKHLGGIPILFIPGNAGSYRQVRSIAAETSDIYFDHYLDQSDGLNPNAKNYDFFTADFNEDFTAFHGRTLLDQAEYLNEAIKFILGLYANSEHPPRSVVVLGHSMGGVVSRVMVSLPNYIPDSINTIITLASPHAAAPLTFDGDILKIYSAVDRFWFQGYDNKETDNTIAKIAKERLSNIALISITGGLLDSILPADYTTLGYLVPPTNGFTVYTTGIPGVWTPIDHLAIVWCAQLRRQVLKALLEIANFDSPDKTYSLERRMEIMRKNFLSGFEDYTSQDKVAYDESADHILLKADSQQINFVQEGQKLKVTPGKMLSPINVFRLPSPKVSKVQFSLLSSMDIGELKSDDNEGYTQPTLLLCNTMDAIKEDANIIDFTNKETTEIAMFKCIDVRDDSNMIPRSAVDTNSLSESSIGGDKSPFYAIQYNSTILKQYDTVIVTGSLGMESNDNENFLLAELSDYNASQFNIHEDLFSLMTRGAKFSLPLDKPLSMNIKIPGAWSSILAYKLKVLWPEDRETTEYIPMFRTFIRQWSNEPYEVKWHVNIEANNQVLLNMHGIAPYTPFKVKSKEEYGLNIEIWTDSIPDKSLTTIRLRIDLLNSLRLLVLRYRLATVSFCVSIILLALVFQVKHYKETDKFPTFLYGLSCICSPWVFGSILFTLSILTPIMSIKSLQKFLNVIDPVVLQDSNEINLSLTDEFKLNSFFLGLEEKSLWFIGPVFFVMSLGIVLLTFYWLLVAGNVIASISRVLLKRLKLSQTEKKQPKPGKLWANRRIIGVLFVLLVIPIYMPYQFAYVVSCIIQLIQVIKILVDDKTNKSILNYHLSLLILMLWVLPINVPILVVFVHNMTINWTTPFSSHHNFLAILPVILLMERYSNSRTLPKMSQTKYKVTQAILAYYVFYCLVYGIRHTYWIHHLFNLLCCWLLVLHYDAQDDTSGHVQ